MKPRGPHQRARCSGCVHTLNTRARGASNTRERTRVRSSISAAICRVICGGHSSFPCLAVPSGSRRAGRGSAPRTGGSARASRRRPSAAPARSRQGRHCASRPRAIRPARSSTFRCLETAGRLMSNGSASSVTDVSPSASRARIARRVGSARAAKVALRRSGVIRYKPYKLNNYRLNIASRPICQASVVE